MKTQGFIHLHRTLLTWNYHNNPSMLAVWTHLLLLAEYEEREYNGVVVKRGELLVSQLWLAQYVGVSIAQLRNCLKILEETNEITRKKTNNVTLIKILKYDDYQGVIGSRNERNDEQNNEHPDKQNNDMERKINNKKNLSDGEIQKVHSAASSPQSPTPSQQYSQPQQPTYPQQTASSRPQRSEFAAQLAKTEFWKSKCCRDYNISPSHINGHIVAFHEYLSHDQPNKTWLSFEDFCRHFHSWLRFQTPENIKRYVSLALKRRQQSIAQRMEAERQQQMWKEIEDTKKKAISYEEYLAMSRNKE